jgi:hypothetical protein
MLQPYSNVIESAREQNQPIEPRSTPIIPRLGAEAGDTRPWVGCLNRDVAPM